MASRHDWHWTFGYNCHISFPNGGDPVVEKDHAFKSDEGCATISDSAGSLLFYTDGVGLFDAADVPITAPNLGGHPSSSHSAIIVPPAGGGKNYHIFAMRAWDVGPVGPLYHSSASVAGGAVALASMPTQLTTLGPPLSSERLAAVPHRDCDKYWVIAMDGGTPPGGHVFEGTGGTGIGIGIGVGTEREARRPEDAEKPPVTFPPAPEPGPGNLYAILVDSDSAPTTQTVTPYPYRIAAAYCCKVSPDGSMIAISCDGTVDLLRFDRATGAFSGHAQLTGFAGNDRSYGVEFSPNGKYLYVSVLLTGKIYRHDVVVAGLTPIASLALVGESPTLVHPRYRVGALQLGPNGKIYGVRVKQPALLEIGDPDSSAPGSVKFRVDALDADGNKLELKGEAVLGLPTFTRMTSDCDDRCRAIAGRVEEQIKGRRLLNPMRPCHGKPVEPRCEPLKMPEIAPQTFIRWGDSRCDCIESDDTEIMHLTVCNPYSNLTLSNLTVHQLVVVDAKGNPVPNLPDGSPSIQLVPVGPYCFGDIPPCTCVSREFVLRLRGAPHGPYHIKVRGICFDACFHGDTEACFTFDVCKD